MQLTCAEISKFRITTQRKISSRSNTMAKSKTWSPKCKESQKWNPKIIVMVVVVSWPRISTQWVVLWLNSSTLAISCRPKTSSISTPKGNRNHTATCSRWCRSLAASPTPFNTWARTVVPSTWQVTLAAATVRSTGPVPTKSTNSSWSRARSILSMQSLCSRKESTRRLCKNSRSHSI